MARTAGQMPRRLSWSDSGALAHAAVSPLGASGAFGAAAGDENARAIAYSGLAALFALPILLLASVLLGIPLAVPAAIALGYLASSYALASDRPRSAAAINAVVFIGLLAWTVGALILGKGMFEVAVPAALLAPCFAAAPALARLFMVRRSDPAAGAAERNAACLDRLAPSEAVLVVRRDGRLLAATHAAEKALGLATDAKGSDVGRFFALLDRPKLANAIACSATDAEPTEITVGLGSGGAGSKATSCTAVVAADEDGVVSIRLKRSAKKPRSVTLSRPTKRERESHVDSDPVSDVREAVDFALRHAVPMAEARRVLLTAEVEAGVEARCERQVCRRILCLMAEGALMQSSAGDALHLTARALKSVVLLRLVGGSAEDGREQGGAEAGEAHAALRRLVEGAGGTLIVDQCAGEMRVSVRLDLPAAQMTEMREAFRGVR